MVSIQDLRPNPQDTSNFYLANIYQTVSDPSRSNISSSLLRPPFTAPKYAVWVNPFWFLSLLISLTCALLATLLQQWARRYLRVTQTRYSHKRARIRSFFAEGVDKFLLLWVVETLPTLLHISLFLIFAGVVLFLCNIDVTTFKLALSWVGICVILYACITFMPVFHHDSPYHTPFSLPAWRIVTGIISWLLERLTRLKCFTIVVFLSSRKNTATCLCMACRRRLNSLLGIHHRRSILVHFCGPLTFWTKITNWNASLRACLGSLSRFLFPPLPTPKGASLYKQC